MSEEAPSQHELIPTEGLAAEFGVALNEPRMRGLRCTGGGPPFVRIVRRVYYRRSDVEAWLAENTRTSTADQGPQAR